MQIYLLILLAFGLAMDAFAVSITNGMCYRMPVLKNALYSGLTFGLFQAAMPLIGFFAGSTFSGVIESFDHWIALILLSFIGGKMIVEVIKERRHPSKEELVREFSVKTLLVQGVATSIDALAVGVSLGLMQVNMAVAVGSIGVITFVCSYIGVCLGKKFGILFKDKAELLGGVILIGIGIRIFVEHMFG